MGLELTDISLTLGGEVHLQPTSLTLERGGFTVLLGATRAGKTTLMHLMAGLERPDTGRIRFDGRDVTGVSVRKRNVALVHQQFINYPAMSVAENIASPLKVARLPKAEIEARVRETADLLRLTPMLERRPSELSGGQQQRTSIARALVKHADLVLLDEPLANLDYKLREELREELPRLFAERGAVVVYATTEPTEALLLGGHTATLHEGRVTGYGPSGELYRRPGDLTTAQVFSEPPMNLARVEKAGQRVTLSEPGAEPVSWEAPMLAGRADGPLTLGLRPHLVHPGAGAGPTVTGRVLVTELSGSESVAHFTLGERSWVALAHGIHPLEIGETAAFTLDTAQALYFAPDGTRIAA